MVGGKNRLKILVFFVLLIAGVLLQYTVLIPGTSLYENKALLILLSVMVYAYQIFLIIWLFSYSNFFVALIVALSCLINIWVNSYYVGVTHREIIYKDAYVTIGYVTKYESVKSANLVYYTFFDKEGQSHDVAERFSGAFGADTILVLFNGSKPCYHKLCNFHPSKDEIESCLSGPRKIGGN